MHAPTTSFASDQRLASYKTHAVRANSRHVRLRMDLGLLEPIRPPFLAYVLSPSVLLSAGPRRLVII